MTRTFLDAGVLMTGWKGTPEERDQAIRIMADDERQFISSQVVRLELLPKPTFHKNAAELAFYQKHFDRVSAVEPFSRELGDAAFDLASRYGLAAADALHIASAIRQGAKQFITCEGPSKPLFRVRELSVVTIFQA